jgi:hypothetical protein
MQHVAADGHVSRPTLPLARRMVSASSSAWVGCSCAPSPALITGHPTFCDSSATAPAEEWRTTRTSGRMALSVIAVSTSVSPFLTLELATDMFITSAPSRLPASSNEAWVRVEDSKNRLIWVQAAQCGGLFLALTGDFDRFVRLIEQIVDVRLRKPLDSEQVAVRK